MQERLGIEISEEKCAVLWFPDDITREEYSMLAMQIMSHFTSKFKDKTTLKFARSEQEIKPIMCSNNVVEMPYILEGKAVCTATHPDHPIESKKSRGRKIHLSKDGEFTVCNMLIDGFIPSSEYLKFQQVHNGKCKNCFKQNSNGK